MVKSPTMVDQKTCNESLHQILEKRQFCGCEICNHRVSMNSSTMEENKSCAKMWLSLRDAVSSETSEKRRQCLESLSPQARRDQALLFQPISVCIQEYICDKQSKLVKLIRLGYETPQSALSVVTELLDMYEKFMDIVADISEFTEREIVPSVNFKDSWISWCKGIFQSVIYSEPVLHQALPEINAQLKKIDERAEDSLIIRQKFNEFCEEMVDSSNSENFPLYVLINECLKEDPVEVDRFKKFCRSLPLHQNVANPSQSGSMMRGDMYSPYVPYSFRDPQVKSGILHQSSVVQLPVLTRDCGVGANAFTDVQLGPFSFPAANGRTFEYVVATTLSQDFANFLRHTGTVEDIHPPSISSDDSPISLSSDDEVQVFTKPSDYAKNSAELFLTDELTGPPVDETTSFPVFNHAEIMSKFYTKAGEIGSENTNEESIPDENLYLPNLLKPSSMSPQNDDMFRVDATVTCRPPFPSPFSHQFGGFPTLVPPPFMVPVLQPQDIGDPSTPMNLFPSLASESQSAPDSVSDLSNHSNTPVLEPYTVAPPSVAVNTSVDNNFSSTPPTMKANTNFIPNASNVPQTVTTTTVQQRKKLVAHGRLGRQNQPKNDEKVTFKPQNQGKVSEQNKSPFVPKVVNSTDSGPDENVGERQHSISVQTEGDEYVVTSASQTELVATEQTSQESPEMSHKGENTSEETSQENSSHAHSPSCSHASKNGHCGHSPPHDQKSECPQRNECKSSEGTGATKYCDCCYCEFFGSGSPAVAPVSKNYPEMRERLRLKLKKNKSCKKEVPRSSKATEAPQQRLKSDLHQLDDRSLEEILNFIEGEAHRIAQPYLKREKQRKARQKNVRENDRKKREKQNSPVPKAESTLVESLKNEKLSDVKRKKDRPSDAAAEGDSGQDLTQQSVKKNGDTSANALKISSEKNGESSPKLPPKSSSREDTPTASKAECERIVREYKKNFLAMAKQQSRVTAGGERVKHAERSEGRVNKVAGGGADETFDRKGDKKSTSKSLDDKPVDTVFLPQEDPVEMDEVEKEIDSFKRFCLDSTRKLREKKITVNWKDFTFKTNKKNQF